MKLMADVIDLAVNKYLWNGGNNNSSQIFSCIAIIVAGKRNKLSTEKIEKIMDFLRSMGIDPDLTQEFDCFPSWPQKQYARALWLTWVAMIAREEGITL